MTELHNAAEKGNLRKVKELLNRGAKINAKDFYGTQPIHLAAIRGHSNVVKELLNRGAKVNAQDTYYRQPIHKAAERGHSNVVKELLNRGANIHAQDFYGNQPIHVAAKKGRLIVVKELISRGANAKSVLNKYPFLRSRVTNYIKKYLENRNVYHALWVYSKAKEPIKNTEPFGFPNKFPINALVKSLKNLHAKNR